MSGLKNHHPRSLDYDGSLTFSLPNTPGSAVPGPGENHQHGQPLRIDLPGGAGRRRHPQRLLDELRCRNGNLTILCGKVSTNREELQPTKGGYL